jgi:hypothetical protein
VSDCGSVPFGVAADDLPTIDDPHLVSFFNPAEPLDPQTSVAEAPNLRYPWGASTQQPGTNESLIFRVSATQAKTTAGKS